MKKLILVVAFTLGMLSSIYADWEIVDSWGNPRSTIREIPSGPRYDILRGKRGY